MSKRSTTLYRASMLLLACAAVAYLACIEAECLALFLIARDLRPASKAPVHTSTPPASGATQRSEPTRPLPDCPS